MQARPAACLVLLSVIADTAAIMQQVRIARAQAARRINTTPARVPLHPLPAAEKPIVAGHTAKGRPAMLKIVFPSASMEEISCTRYLEPELGRCQDETCAATSGHHHWRAH